MRKEIVASRPDGGSHPRTESGTPWLNVEDLARVEVSSEDELFPIENALALQPGNGWRAASTGPQTIRLLFDQPQTISHIHLHIIERAAERSQEFTLRAGSSPENLREIVRQQFTFSPSGTTEETEDYSVNLTGVLIFDLHLDPDRSHDPKSSINYASVAALRLS